MADGTVRAEGDDSLAIRAAWLHYAGGLTQAQVAERLNVSAAKAHRLIAAANRSGAVKVTVVGEVAECAELGSELSARFALGTCEVVPDLGEPGLPLRALGAAGANFLKREIDAAPDGVIGLGHGRTLGASVEAMAPFDARGLRFVSLMGGLARNLAANPHDVMHRMAQKTRAAAYVIPIPFFAASAADREVLLSQPGVSDVFDLAASADLMAVGIGTTKPDAQLVESGMIGRAEIAEIQERGGVGEVLGHFFAPDGAPIETGLTARTVSLERRRLAGRRIVAIAGGPEKVHAIRAVLHGGYVGGLVTDERTARSLLEESGG
ncbi:sugar-binding transcriptional regulator [Tranquillimonas rosea]|uniref:sugar-binding transcriptional regulator n=1 Tax=Tranquillimonas rosea TaxID=641238 RepID=UPI003BABA620